MPIRQYTVPAACIAKDCDECPVKRDSRGAPFAPRCWAKPARLVAVPTPADVRRALDRRLAVVEG